MSEAQGPETADTASTHFDQRNWTRSGAGWLTTSVLAGAGITLALAAIIWLDFGGAPSRSTGIWSHNASHVWHSNLQVPIVSAYLLAVYPVLRRLFAAARMALTGPGRSTGGAELRGTSTGMGLPHKTQTAALIGGGVLGFLPHMSWIVDPPGTGFIYAFHVVGTTLIYALTMRVVVFGLAGTLRLNRLVSGGVTYDVLNPIQLEPFADWSLGLTSVCTGGITLSLLFDLNSYGMIMTPLSVAMYALLCVIAVLLFFVNTWSVHRMMLAAKKQELGEARRQLRMAFADVAARSADGRPIEPGSPASFLGNWLDVERRLVAAPSWPYTSETLRRLGASVFMPLGLYIVQLVISRTLR